MAKFYAAANDYASENSRGFANTWYVLAFDSRKARDAYVNNAKDLATHAITKKEIGKYIDRPKPFSMEHWGIDDDRSWYDARVHVPGFLGTVECVHEFDARGKSYKGRVYS